MPVSQISFTVHLGSQTQTITSDDLKGYAEAYRLERYAPGRFSWLFVLNMLVYEQIHRINSFHVSDEIRDLELGHVSTRTKAASEFTRDPLRGLWHKHFFAGRFIAHNIQNHLSGGKLAKLVNEVFDPKKSSTVQESMIRELAHRVTTESLQKRAEAGKLTGEWIVFAKHESKNYYLCLASHGTGDQTIFENLKASVWPQFPFLAQ